MTKEEIIENLQYQNKKFFGGQSQALIEAIKLVKQQPSDDCISRKAVIDNIDSISKHHGGISDIRLVVKVLPPVTPTHGICKDCEHYRRIELNSCDEVIATCKKHTDRNYQYISPNFYCADFEKRGGE